MNLLFYLSFNFIIYSFIGWIIEEAYSLSVNGNFKKEGFLIGPFKPMYGIAFTILILCDDIWNSNGIFMIIVCFLVPTTVEYISGYMLKHIFNKVYWDYSKHKYNIDGLVTFSFSTYWTILSLFGIYFIQPILYNIYTTRENLFNIATIIGMIYLVIDLFFTLKHIGVEELV